MKTKLALAALAIPTAFAAYVTLHPGVAYAETPLARLAQGVLETGSYTADPMHTSVGFEVNHMGLNNIQGRFTKVEGKLKVVDNDPRRSSVDFTIQADSVDTAVTPRDNHLRSADFFEVAKFPTLSFKSAGIRRAGKGYVADGALTIKGVTCNVSLPFNVYGPLKDQNGTRVGVVVAPFKLNRLEYGVGADQKLPNGASAIGTEILIRVGLEATLDK
jgi:polyisoprenoid-binding protein YceI